MSPRTLSLCRLYFISFGTIVSILVPLKPVPLCVCVGGGGMGGGGGGDCGKGTIVCSLANDRIAYEETL